MVFVDDSHASGFMGKRGRGVHEHCGVMGKIDIITTTLGKGLGGASGGCVSGRREFVELCRQKARPYLFSNAVAPSIVQGAIKVLDLLEKSTDRRDKLERNTAMWRKLLKDAGFDIKEGDSPIIPVMLYNAKLSQDVARDLFYEGIYVVGFFFPVVPKAQARIRTQMSAAHETKHLEQAIEAFKKVGKKYDILGKGRKENHRHVRAVALLPRFPSETPPPRPAAWEELHPPGPPRGKNSTPPAPRLAWQGGGSVRGFACVAFHVPPSSTGRGPGGRSFCGGHIDGARPRAPYPTKRPPSLTLTPRDS